MITIKYAEPAGLVEWRKTSRTMPHYCHTCESFNRTTAMCSFHKSVVPEDFAGKLNGCDSWIGDIPF